MTVDIPEFVQKPIEYIRVNKEDYFNMIEGFYEVRHLAWNNGLYAGIVLGILLTIIVCCIIGFI